MKKHLPLFLWLFFVLAYSGYAQEELIIDLDFQDWEASLGVKSDPPDSCEVGVTNITGPDTIMINYETGGSGAITLWKYFVSPLCNTKYVNRGDAAENNIDVTTGFVSLGKAPNEGDTVGQFILPKLSNVTWIEFAYSCTGSERGVRIFKSTDDGETWEGPIGGEHILAGVQLGEFATEDINSDDVIIKITSGIDDEGNSQYTRIHNIQVFGVPAGPETGLSDVMTSSIKAFYSANEEGLVIRGDVKSVSIYDITGRLMIESFASGNQTITLSSLSNGIYFLKAHDRENKVYTRKFIKR